jgi:hypothetical protein
MMCKTVLILLHGSKVTSSSSYFRIELLRAIVIYCQGNPSRTGRIRYTNLTSEIKNSDIVVASMEARSKARSKFVKHAIYKKERRKDNYYPTGIIYRSPLEEK